MIWDITLQNSFSRFLMLRIYAGVLSFLVQLANSPLPFSFVFVLGDTFLRMLLR